MGTQPRTFLTPEQYLEIDRAAEFRSEYLNGKTFAMSGAKSIRTSKADVSISQPTCGYSFRPQAFIHTPT
jgi:hypothetical protein